MIQRLKAGLLHTLRKINHHEFAELSRKLDVIYASVIQQAGGGSPAAGQNPFWHYQSGFDAVATMQKFAAPSPAPTPGFLTNYLGVKIDPDFLPEVLKGSAGTVEAMPLPNNWHTDIAELAAALRAVDLAGSHFVVAELGCGWGCWLNITGAAAMRSGRSVRLIGVEGDEGHVAFAQRSLTTNGFGPTDFTIINGIAGAKDGTALFPRQPRAGIDWGLAPELQASKERITDAVTAGTHVALDVVSIATLAEHHGPLDLLHVDIQGGEADLLEASIDVLNRSVRYVVVGTHSRAIEGRLETLFLGQGWMMEMDRPAISRIESGARNLWVDGVQGWRNTRSQ